MAKEVIKSIRYIPPNPEHPEQGERFEDTVESFQRSHKSYTLQQLLVERESLVKAIAEIDAKLPLMEQAKEKGVLEIGISK